MKNTERCFTIEVGNEKDQYMLLKNYLDMETKLAGYFQSLNPKSKKYHWLRKNEEELDVIFDYLCDLEVKLGIVKE